ncbi:MAG: amidohydrolase [Alphaproteobacteria bacterium]|nr:amidohydrolase [Alphaproteobacteria bacterium]
MDELSIVDAHHHLWDLDGPLRYPWLNSGEHSYLGDYSAIRRSYLPPEYRRDTTLHKVIATVHVEAECDRGQQVAETRWLGRIHTEFGMPNAIVAHAWVDTPNAEEILAQHKQHPLVRGIRTKPVTAHAPGESVRGQPRSLQDPNWRKGLALLEKYDLSWDLRVPWWHLEEAAEVCRLYPTMRIVLNHTGYPWHRDEASLAAWRQGMRALALCPNVWCKISALCVKDRPWTLAENGPLIRQTIDLFGAERCMFASNFPVDSLKGSWDYIYSGFKRAVADLPRAQQAGLFAGNAIRFYRLSV